MKSHPTPKPTALSTRTADMGGLLDTHACTGLLVQRAYELFRQESPFSTLNPPNCTARERFRKAGAASAKEMRSDAVPF